jgi:HlyD family secretion protein
LYGRVVELLQGGVEVEIPSPDGPRKVTVPVPDKLEQARRQRNIASQESWSAHAAVDQARTAQEAGLRAVNDLQRQVAEPMGKEAQVHAAQAAYTEAAAAIGVAEAAVADLQAGPRPEDLAVSQSAVEQARAAQHALVVQRQKTVLTAPASGLIVESRIARGETLAAGAPVLRIADLEQLTLTIYLSEKSLGEVRLGQAVEVTVDSFPGRTFRGAVRSVATEAQFTPRNVQTRQERTTVVYAIKVDLPNPDHALKPGMPADAIIRTEGQP